MLASRRDAVSTHFRLSLFYALVFGFVGVYLPYWPLWLADRGVGPELLGALMAFGFIAKLAVNPLFAVLAGRFRERRPVLVVAAAASTLVFAGFAFATSLPLVIVVQLLFFLTWVPVMPATENLTIAESRLGHVDYGRVRLWGSISFIAVSMLTGYALDGADLGRVHVASLSVLVLVLLAARLLPRSPAGAVGEGFPLRGLLGLRGLPSVILAAALIQGSHAMFYSFGSIHWRGLGIGETAIGVLWAEGVMVEVLVFLFAARLRVWLSPAAMLAIGGAAAALRWTAMPYLEQVVSIGLIQSLHGITFGMTHLGAMAFISARVPEGKTAGAIALYSMVVMGLFMGIAVLISGWLYGWIGARGFLAMALWSVVGTAVAVHAMRRGRA